MNQIYTGRPSLRSALLLGAASATAIALSLPAFAQDQAPVETVVVTGSRIPQQGLYSSSPVTAIGQQEMKFEGTTNVENLINNLPSAFADQGDTVANGATGTATVNLRDLGVNRTLVLIDGQRLMPGDPITPVPDLNFIPAALVDHVEVVTGGASAVYGSDAVAGVVNFIMRKDFEGIEFDGTDSIAQHTQHNDTIASALSSSPVPIAPYQSSLWDGNDADATVIMGTNTADGKGNVTIYAGYRNLQAVTQDTRDFSACSTATTFSGGFRCFGSSNSAEGRFFPANATPENFTSISASPVQGEYEGFTNANRYNFAPFNYFQRPDERYTLGGYGHYEINKSLDFFTRVMFMDDNTVAQIAPSGIFTGSGPDAGNYIVNCSNPFLGSQAPGDPSFYNALCANEGLGPNDNSSFLVGYRLPGIGPRQDHLRHDDFLAQIGVKGDIGAGWSYQVVAQTGRSIFGEEYTNDASASRISRALQVVDVNGVPTCTSVINGSDPNCVPLNIFKTKLDPATGLYIADTSQASLDYVRGNGFKEGGNIENSMSANITGDLGAWGIQSPSAKSPVAISIGAEYREDLLDFRPDFEIETGDLTGQGGPSAGVNAGINVEEGFGEINVPLVQGAPFVEDLTANAAYRYSSYNLAGNVSSFKYGAEWQVVDDFRLRADYQRAVRAPNVLELFTPNQVGLVAQLDGCSSDFGGNGFFSTAQCLHTFQRAISEGRLTTAQATNLIESGSIPDCPAAQCSGLIGGNTNLKPETSNTLTLGVVFTPTFLDGFTATIDYFSIDVKKAISAVSTQIGFAECAVNDIAGYCNLINRAGTGILFGTSGYTVDLPQNTGKLKTEGVDFEANYQTDMDDWGMHGAGTLAFNFLGTYLKDFEDQPATGALDIGTYDCAGMFGVICGTPAPKWRHKLRVTWSSPWDFDLSLSWRHMSAVKFDGDSSAPLLNFLATNAVCFTAGGCNDISDNHIAPYDYIDLASTWAVRPGIELRAGITNVFDKDPPVLDTNSIGVSAPPFGNGNTFPQVYDTLGRVIFVGATLKY